jgi:trk system potassium uptake protein TrkA
MGKQVCVIGLGQFGAHLARALVKMGCEVLAIDTNERRVDDLRDDVHRAIVGDARNYHMLAGVLSPTLSDAVICLGETNLEPSILCALNLKRLGITSIRSTAANDDHAQILQAVGATETIFPERDAAQRTARRVANPDIRDMFPLAEDYRIMELEAPGRTHGKSLAQLDLRAAFDILVLAVREISNPHFRFLPPADKVIKPDEILMVLGRELDLARFAAFE